MKNYDYIDSDGEQRGPVAYEELNVLYREKRIHINTPILGLPLPLRNIPRVLVPDVRHNTRLGATVSWRHCRRLFLQPPIYALGVVVPSCLSGFDSKRLGGWAPHYWRALRARCRKQQAAVRRSDLVLCIHAGLCQRVRPANTGAPMSESLGRNSPMKESITDSR